MSTACPYDIKGLPTTQAGVAKTVITPPLGTGLAGYFHERIATSVKSDLHCHVLVLGSGENRLALISCDVICFSNEMADEIKKLVHERAGIAPEFVLIHATHTHTGPVMHQIALLPCDTDYLAQLPGHIADTVAEATADLFDCFLVAGRREESSVGSNRLGRRSDGQEVFSKTDVLGPAGPIDPEVLSLAVRDATGSMRAMVVNYAMHPDVIGGGSADFFSPDWPGYVGDTISDVYGEDVVTVFLNGACGDINHREWTPTRLPQGGPAKSLQMGRVIASAAIAAAETGEVLEAAECRGSLEVLEIPFFTRDEAFLAELEVIRTKSEAERVGWEKVILGASERWRHDGEIARVPVHAMRFGDVVFVGLPGEVFVRWGLEIKHWSPGRFTFVAELANGCVGYIPTTDQAQRGAYGAKPILSRQLIADGGRQIADAVQVLVCSLWE
ncbi:MAG: hypothetical protein KAI66_20215 [Lentisphaeria bacterium]|nr:hypothetical protein [Lentisphaeria bacterium]